MSMTESDQIEVQARLQRPTQRVAPWRDAAQSVRSEQQVIAAHPSRESSVDRSAARFPVRMHGAHVQDIDHGIAVDITLTGRIRAALIQDDRDIRAVYSASGVTALGQVHSNAIIAWSLPSSPDLPSRGHTTVEPTVL